MLKLFLENSYIPLYGITFLVSLYRYPKYYDTHLKYLPIIFIYTFLNEILGDLIFKNPEYRFFGSDAFAFYNMVIYNIYSVIFYLYFFFIYRFYIDNEKIKKTIQIAGIVFLVVATINPFFQNFVASAQTGTYVVGGLIILVCVACYFRQLFTSETKTNWKNNLLFWISLGLLIFYLGYLPIKVLRQYHTVNGTVEGPLIRPIHLTLIILMYISIVIGFIRMKKRLIK